MEPTPFYKVYLDQELARRVEKNPRYSMRAFAKALGIDVGNLSRFIAGKAFLSSAATEKVLQKLDLTPDERQLFVDSFIEEQKRRKLEGSRFYLNKMKSKFRQPPTLDIEIFRVLGDWYHCALLELTFVEGFRAEPKWIASQLGIGQVEAKLALERLIALGLLEKKNGTVLKTQDFITTKDKHISTVALRKLQKQFLQKAQDALENTPIEKRSQSAMTMAIDPKKIPLAKKLIEEFTAQLCEVLTAGKQKQVYQLSVSLFPIQKEEES